MASATEFFNTWNEGFAKKDSSRLAELLTDDFQWVSKVREMGKQEHADNRRLRYNVILVKIYRAARNERSTDWRCSRSLLLIDI